LLFLAVLGVDPELQGQGIGGALLQPVLDRADQHELPCYLETVEPSNLPFYSRHGFGVLDEGVEPTSDLRYWTLLRSPQ
jgi:predicted N-acetyltransferase YhbS